MQRILIIQTAFIGDVVLATGLLEKLHTKFPNASLDMLVRKGNENLFTDHPFLNEVLIWNKQQNKYGNLWTVLSQVRARKYAIIINVQRYAATGLLTVLANAGQTIGFDKNPFSRFFSTRIKHITRGEFHEYQRNHGLIMALTDEVAAKPRLYPTPKDEAFIKEWNKGSFICIAPASVWATKQFPVMQWVKLVNALPVNQKVYLLGASSDHAICEEIRRETKKEEVYNLAGKLGFLQSAALMKGAIMNFVNDSAPMHFASAVNAPVTAVYCSTLPSFGYGPLSDNSHIVEIAETLPCRPCGIHGHQKCPLGHFHCATRISNQQLLSVLPF